MFAMFAGRTSRIVTALCTLIGILALVTIGVLTFTGGSEFTEFALVMVFFVSFLVGLTGGSPFLSLLPPS